MSRLLAELWLCFYNQAAFPSDNIILGEGKGLRVGMRWERLAYKGPISTSALIGGNINVKLDGDTAIAQGIRAVISALESMGASLPDSVPLCAC